MKRFLKWEWILCAVAILLLAVYFAFPESKLTGDDLKYQKLWTQLKWARRFDHLQKSCPEILSHALQLSTLKYRAQGRAGQLQHDLSAAGFLNEYEVAVTNFPATMTDRGLMFQELFRRMKKLESARVFWTFNMPSNNFVFTCRPQDLPLIQRAANQP